MAPQLTTPNPRWVARCHQAALVLSVLTIVVALTVLAGWILRIPFITTSFMGRPPTSPWTAAGLLTAAIALLLLVRSNETLPPLSRDVVLAFSGLTSLLGAVTLLAPGIDATMRAEGLARNLSALAAGTSWLSRIGLLMLGGAIALTRRSRFMALAEGLAYGVWIAFFSVIAGLLFNIEAVSSLSLVVGIGSATPLAFVALATALILARPGHGLGAVIVSESAGGRLARYLLIPVVSIPFVLDWFELLGQRRGIYSPGVGWVLDATATVAALGTLVWWTAVKLHRADRERLEALEKLAESEERYRSLIESSPDAVVVKDRDQVELVNNAALQLLGAGASHEIIGRSLLAFVHPEDRERLQRTCRVLDNGGMVPSIEERLVRIDGRPLDVEVSATALEVRGRRLAQIVARDITERKRESLALRESEQRLRLIAETISEVFWIADVDLTTMIYVSPAYERIWGAPRQELYDNPQAFLDTIYPADRDRVRDVLRVNKRAGRPFDHEYRIIRPDGELRWIWERGFPVPNAAGPVLQYVGVAQDVTARKRTEEGARRNLERFELAARATGEALWEVDIATNTAWWSDTYYEHYGYRRDTSPTMEAWADHIHPEDRERVVSGFRTAIARGLSMWSAEYRYRLANGSYADVLDRAYVMTDADGHRRLIGAILDVTERRRADSLLRQSEQRFRATFEQAPVGMTHVSLDGHLLRVNHRLCDILGYAADELLGKPLDALIHPQDRPAASSARQRLLSGTRDTTTRQTRLVKKDGSLVWCESTTSFVRDESDEPGYIFLVIRDITQERADVRPD